MWTLRRIIHEHSEELEVFQGDMCVLKHCDVEAVTEAVPLHGLEQEHLTSPEHATPPGVAPEVRPFQRNLDVISVSEPGDALERPREAVVEILELALPCVVAVDVSLVQDLGALVAVVRGDGLEESLLVEFEDHFGVEIALGGLDVVVGPVLEFLAHAGFLGFVALGLCSISLRKHLKLGHNQTL